MAHACGHDVHTTALLGAGFALAEVHAAGLLPGRVRLLFQPAEEVMPGGALRLMNLGALDDVSRIFCLHCDPTIDVGQRRPARGSDHRRRRQPRRSGSPAAAATPAGPT